MSMPNDKKWKGVTIILINTDFISSDPEYFNFRRSYIGTLCVTITTLIWYI